VYLAVLVDQQRADVKAVLRVGRGFAFQRQQGGCEAGDEARVAPFQFVEVPAALDHAPVAFRRFAARLQQQRRRARLASHQPCRNGRVDLRMHVHAGGELSKA